MSNEPYSAPMKALTGARERDRTVKRSIPLAPGAIGGPPAELSSKAVELWYSITPALCEARIIGEMDIPLVAAYVQTYALYLELVEDVSARGIMVSSARSDGDLVKNPSVAMSRDALNALRGILADLGITPTARAKVALPVVPGEADSGSLAEYMADYLDGDDES